MSVLGRSVLWLARILAALILLWLAGLVWFVASSYWIRPDPSNTTDAIVVVTERRLLHRDRPFRFRHLWQCARDRRMDAWRGLSQPAPGHQLVPYAAQPPRIRARHAASVDHPASGLRASCRSATLVEPARGAAPRARRVRQISHYLGAA